MRCYNVVILNKEFIMMHINRRQFVKLSLTALGGAMLTGCGLDAGTSSDYPLIPNSYSFYKIKDYNDTVLGTGNSFQISSFYGSTHISNNGIISFDAVDSNKRRGIFQIGMDLNGRTPRLEWERAALVTGDTLDDGRIVSSIRSYDFDHEGDIAAILEADLRGPEDHYGAGLYIENDQAGFEPVLLAGQTFNSDSMMSSGIFGDVSYMNDNIIVSAHHLPAGDSDASHMDSLVHIPDATLSASQIILSSGSLIPDTAHTAASFGLIDHNSFGDFTAGVFIASQDSDSKSKNDLKSLNITGNVNYAKDIQARSLSLDSGDINNTLVESQIGYGSRVGANGDTYDLIQSNELTKLHKNGNPILNIGDLVAKKEILGINTGSVGADGLYYYTAFTQSGGVSAMTLFAYNGDQHVPIISSGDKLSDSGAYVERILFGTSTGHVDNENRIVFLCSFSDGTTSLMLGIPS